MSSSLITLSSSVEGAHEVWITKESSCLDWAAFETDTTNGVNP